MAFKNNCGVLSSAHRKIIAQLSTIRLLGALHTKLWVPKSSKVLWFVTHCTVASGKQLPTTTKNWPLTVRCKAWEALHISFSVERLNNFEHPWGQNILTWWVKCPGVAFRGILMHTLTTSTPLRGGVCTAELFVAKKKQNNSAPSTSFSERRFPFHQVWFFFFANWSGDRMVSFKFEFDNCNANFSVVLRLRTTDKLITK